MNMEDKIDSIFQEYNNVDTPGLVVGVLEKNNLIFEKAYGVADLSDNEPLKSSSILSLASVSKQFTVLAIKLLEAEGRLSMKDDIRKYIPELRNFKHTITIQHLANHTSGLRSHLELLGMAGYDSHDDISGDIIYKLIFQQEALNFVPGEAFSYSNSGYVLLAEIVERVSGIPFSKFMNLSILKPLGMKNSFIFDSLDQINDDVAPSYRKYNQSFRNIPVNHSYAGSTGLFTTIEDLSKWVQSFSFPQVGSSEIYMDMNTQGRLNNGNTSGYALGQFVGQYKGYKLYEHGGADGGYVAYLVRFPETRLSVFLLSNNGTLSGKEKALKIANLFLPQAKDVKQEAGENIDKGIAISAEEIKKFAGQYMSKTSFLVREISLKDGRLTYLKENQAPRFLRPLTKQTFQFIDGEIPQKLEFRISDSIQMFSFIENDKVIDAFELCVPVSYASHELKQFAGTFFSKELETTYHIKYQNGKLIIRHPRMGTIKLSPLKRDVFISDSWRFNIAKFVRNDLNEIDGVLVSKGRARHVYFDKQ